MLISFKEPIPFFPALHLTTPHERKNDTEFHCLTKIARNNLLKDFFLIFLFLVAKIGYASTLY